jgi:hypothetical protein
VDSLHKRPKQQNTDMIFRTWNVRSLYRADLLETASKELSKYKLHLVGVQEIRFFYGKANDNHELSTGSSVHKGIISAVKKVEFVSDRMTYNNTERSLVSYHCSERSCPNLR